MFQSEPTRGIAEYVGSNNGQGRPKLSKLAQKIVDSPVEPAVSSMVIVGTVQALETAMLALLGIGIYFVYVNHVEFSHYAALIGVSLLISLFAFNITKSHEIGVYRSRIVQTGRAFGAWAATLGLVLVGMFLLKLGEYFSRVWIVSWFALGAIAIALFRLMVRRKIIQWTREGRLKRRTVIVGGGQEAEFLIESIRQTAVNDVELLGMFDDRTDKRSPDMVADCPKLGKVSDLLEFARQTRVDLIIVSLPVSAEARVLQMVKQLWVLPVDIRLSAHMSKLKFKNRAYSFLGDVPVFDMADKPISDWNLVVKWLFDKIVALAALVLLSPVMLVVAILIKLDSKGPVFFKQKRHGFNNELIEVYKFRSMYTDMSDAQASKLVTKDDPRVTKIGRFIRKTSIDELPQFINVLRGDLSICGPRPHALQAKAANQLYHDAVDGYFARHRVKPGITGWAQIHGWRGETDTTEKLLQRVSHDLHYIENWSIFLDIYILFMTPISLVSKNEGAY